MPGSWPAAFLALSNPENKWKCTECYSSNDIKDSSCLSCTAPRVASENAVENTSNLTKPVKPVEKVQAKRKPTGTTKAASKALKKPKKKTSSTTPLPTSGVVKSCGAADCGQLGVSLTEDEFGVQLPRQLATITTPIRAVAAGGMHGVALTESGKEVYTWGGNDDKVLGRETTDEDDGEVPGLIPKFTESTISAIAAGDCHSVALDTNGTVYTWGTYKNSSGYLGYDSSTEKQLTPHPVKFYGKKVSIVSVASGDNHTLALDSTGQVFSWGDGENGQLARKSGVRHLKFQLTPARVVLPGRRNVATGVYCGSFHSFIKTKEHGVYAFGLNNYGQLGLKVSSSVMTPTRISALTEEVLELDGGMHHSIALTSTGDVYTFGRCDSGQSGVSDFATAVKNPTPVLVTEFEDKMVQVKCGLNHCMALSLTGEAFAWGYGEMSQCGVSEDGIYETPVKMEVEEPVITIDGGGQFSLLVAGESS